MPWIPFSGSLLFAPDPDATPPPCRVHVGFTPRWFRQHADIDFGRRWHLDPDYRFDSFVRMGEALNRQFPLLRLGGEPSRTIGTVSQIQTTALVGGILGMEILYFPDQWPANHGLPLSDDQADRYTPPDFGSSPVFADLMAQMDRIERRWGTIRGSLNMQGVLNLAFRLRGEAIFEDMVVAPERAHRLIEGICDLLLGVVDAIHARRAAAGAPEDAFITANCVVNMISEAAYRAFVMPCDRRLSDHFPRFGIHNCAWNVDHYAEAYAQIRTLGYLDFGIQSDLPRLRRMFPETNLVLMYTPMDLANRTPDQIRADLARVHRELGRCHIVVADIDAGTPNERVSFFCRTAAECWGLPLAEIVAAARNY